MTSNTFRSGKVVVILGPTASGKSDIAIKLARQFNGEVISADSRQVYRGMNIGTGKVTGVLTPVIPEFFASKNIRDTQRKPRIVFISEGIPHHMLDIVSPNTEYNVAKYKKRAQKIIKDILKRGKLPIICGGTGFWIKAVVDNIDFPEVKPDQVLRNMLSNKSTDELFRQLKKLDPERAETIDPKNKVRLIRAIEICKAIGKVPNLNQESRIMDYGFIQIGISVAKEELDKKIKSRLEQRFEQGMIDEVKNLHLKSGVSWKRLESFGLEYYWISLYLQGNISESEMREKLYFDIIHYAKRQMTWFKKDKRIVWLKNLRDIEKEVQRFSLKN